MIEKKQRGAPRGNQNARKHGFYSRALDEACEVECIDEERSDEAISLHGQIAAPSGLAMTWQGSPQWHVCHMLSGAVIPIRWSVLARTILAASTSFSLAAVRSASSEMTRHCL